MVTSYTSSKQRRSWFHLEICVRICRCLYNASLNVQSEWKNFIQPKVVFQWSDQVRNPQTGWTSLVGYFASYVWSVSKLCLFIQLCQNSLISVESKQITQWSCVSLGWQVSNLSFHLSSRPCQSHPNMCRSQTLSAWNPINNSPSVHDRLPNKNDKTE